MKIVLLSGGSGQRLWPLSSEARSKQFLKVLKNEKNEQESMIQRIWRQLKQVKLADSSFISTYKGQVDMIQNQLGQEPSLIVEPFRKDTFSAISLAAAYLYSEADIALSETICIIPVDPYVEDEFFLTIQKLEEMITKTDLELVLLGVHPTHPSEKYGYILPDQEVKSEVEEWQCMAVKQFVEKPKKWQAEQLIQQNALWNCGVFAFRLNYLISILERRGLPTSYVELLKVYEGLPKISFDYEVVEKANRIAVMPFYGDWKDLGNWEELTALMGVSILGKGMICQESKNTHLINELNIPVSIIGLSNVIVAASPDGIMAADKSSSPNIKELLKDFRQRPMYEEKRWGWYKVLEHFTMKDGSEVLVKRLRLDSGKNLSYQYHHKRSEVWTIIEGIGEFVLDGRLKEVKPGDVLQISVGAKHGLKALTDLEMIEVQTGSELIEEDIVRICMNWEEVKGYCL